MNSKETTALALSCAIALSIPFAAHADEAPSTVVITGSRFPSVESLEPIGATVITRDEIRQAGVNDVNQAIRKIGGVFGRQSLDASPDFALDLRGFGTNGAQNMVVMVDGVRLNENELSGPLLSTIPIDTVERIEIIRGGSSVLYGEGATGGVIQIVTRKEALRSQAATLSARPHGSVFGEAGQFRERDLRASLSHVAGALSFDAAVARQDNGNYRDNSDFTQNSVTAGLQLAYTGGRAGVRVESARQDSRLPGSLTLAQFRADPTQTQTPNDFGSLDTDRVNAFAEYRLGAVDLAAELSHRERDAESNYYFGSSASVTKYKGRQNQFSPRARWLSDAGAGMLNELVAGIDVIDWKRKTTADYSLADASQKSRAIYVRDELRFDPAHDGRVALGARRELFDKDYVDAIMGGTPDNGSQGQNAWEAQGSYRVLPQLTLTGRAGQSYRVANVDENSFRTSLSLLKVQTSHDLELGASWGSEGRKLTARVFRHKLDNEIFYDPTAFANTNLDPTRRQGFEIDAEAMLAPGWRVTAHLQHVNASFTDGPNAGREMVLVPKNVLTARLAWLPGNGQSADLGAQWVDRQRNGSDFDNSCAARMPSYASFDARYAVKLGAWEVAVNGLNLADRHYYSYAYGCQSGIYPSDGRQLKLSARYDF
ncbi:outer membrane hemin/siderophore receptor protein [Massilia sp. WF1]|uniref:TonB-dependent receptor n=1 Tax=unclassified Massilia TaxID=2609279 RepID=UPI000649723F|nr:MULTISPECIES: TonB-dependent receptor [unclassified Massilia]ALK96296.1 outer membrane hemin/siderophore receptor protein [Massilia sp. WG5]KLU37717.1 outer membrane hemin/siderophore receptor protein [Massilia sp. WF1]